MPSPHSAAASANRRARSRGPPNPSPAPPADGSNLQHQLLHAARDGDLRLLKRLVRALDEGRGRPWEAVEAAKDDGVGALHVAARNGWLPVCRYLVEELGVDVDAVTHEAGTPLVWAMLAGRVDSVSYLLAHGANPSRADDEGFTPLHHAAGTGKMEKMASFATDCGIYLGRAEGRLLSFRHNKIVPGIDTPLLAAIHGSSVKCVRLLVEAGADVNDGLVTPLVSAADKGLTTCLTCLLEAGADPNAPDPSGRMPIEIAALNGTRKDVEILFPVTSCIPTVHDWSIDGIICHAKSVYMEQFQNARRIAELRSLAANSIKRNDYFTAGTLYSAAMEHDRHDATLLSNRSLCCLRLGDGHTALQDALACREMRPNWPKACYRQGAALMFLKDYAGACDAFLDAAKLDPLSAEIEAALRNALNSMKISGGRKKAV